MYYTGINPLDGKKVYAPDDYREKLMQRALLQYKKPENRNLVREALKLAGREDLIGFSGNCLVKPDMRVGSEYYNADMQNNKKASQKSQKQAPKNNRNSQKNSKKDAKNTKSSNKFSPNKAKNSLKKNDTKVSKNRHVPAKNAKKGKR